MLWGVVLQPGEPYTELVVDEIRLSMASLEFRSSKTTVPCPTSHVVVTTVKGEYLLCSLEKGSTPQQSLDLVLQPKEEVTFCIEGTGVVHLTGYTPESPLAQEYVEVSPEEDMIYVDEQGSDEPDLVRASQVPSAQSNVKSEESSATIEGIYPDEIPGRQNLDTCSDTSNPVVDMVKTEQPDNISSEGLYEVIDMVKTEQLDNISSEGLYEGWILEDHHPVNQSSGFSEDEGSHDDEDQDTVNNLSDNSIKLQPTSINPLRKQLRSSSILVNQAKGVLKKLKQMPYQCSYCFKEFSSKLACRRHQDAHSEAAVSTSNGVLYTNASNEEEELLEDNDPSHREERQKKKSSCTVGRPYSCKICKTSFTLLTSYIAHQRLHSVDNAVKVPPYQAEPNHSRSLQVTSEVETSPGDDEDTQSRVTDGPRNREQPNHCQYCRKPFSSNSKRVLHERKHTGEKPYKCKHCLRGFAAVGDCKRHEQLHTEEGMINLPRCRYCSKPFYSISKCLIHERIHTGEKPFKCGLCDRAFSQKGHLKTHERTHTGERPYQCQHCDRGFSTGSGRKKHERLHTGKKSLKLK